MGEVKVVIENEKLIQVDKATFIEALSPHVSEDTLEQLKKLQDPIDPQRIPLPLRLNFAELKLELPLDINLRSRDSTKVMDQSQKRYEAEALAPAPIGGAINYRMEQSWATENVDNQFFSTQFDSFLNVKSLVLENQTFYQTNKDQMWFRGDTRVVKDFEKSQIRVQAGDVYPQIQGFMSPRPLGGVNVSRNFTLNPYRLPYPTGTQDFSLNSRSFVKYFVNGSLIRSEYLPAGNYTAKDIPLNNGLNTILIETTDDLGQKKIFVFKSSASINLLNEGESRFDISYGVPFQDQNLKRDYLYDSGKFLSSYFQYGFRTDLSASVYAQNQLDYTLSGIEFIKATTVGNFTAGHARSFDQDLKGMAQSLSYQLIGQGGRSFQSQTLALRWEHRSEDFRSSALDVSAAVANNYAVNYTLPLASVLTASLGGNYGDVRDNSLSDRYGIDTTLNLRLFDHHNLSIFVGRNRDENKVWNDVAYVFLTIAFPNSNDFVSTFYDQKEKSTKLTYMRDNQNRLYRPKAQAILENNSLSQSGEVDVLVPTPFAELGTRVRSDHIISNDTVIGRGSLRMNSAFVFAYDKQEFGFGVSRPINNSFVLFKPEKRMKDQKIALKSNSPFTEAQNGLFDEITFGNLLPYQYREIQLDPTFMDEGYTLQKEKYVLYPTYKSAHLIRLEEKGAVILRGKLVQPDGTPWALQVGNLSGNTFFTNREGEFFIEGVERGKYNLNLEGNETSYTVNVSATDLGYKDLGVITLEDEE